MKQEREREKSREEKRGKRRRKGEERKCNLRCTSSSGCLTTLDFGSFFLSKIVYSFYATACSQFHHLTRLCISLCLPFSARGSRAVFASPSLAVGACAPRSLLLSLPPSPPRLLTASALPLLLASWAEQQQWHQHQRISLACVCRVAADEMR